MNDTHPIGDSIALPRRAILAGLLVSPIAGARAAALPTIRLGILPFGSVQWIADVIARHHLDQAHGFSLQTQKIANTEAGKVALLGHAVDIAVSDWPFVAAQRLHGGHLCFAAGPSSSLGGIVVPAASPVHRLADLKGLRLGVAGGPADKSWLLIQAAGRRQGIDLAREATLSYGAPPLLEAMQAHGDLDALLTFWNFAARLESQGEREAISVAECAGTLGITQAPVLVGFVFDDQWAAANRAALDGFFAAADAAVAILANTPAEWASIRPLMKAPTDALFENLRRRFIAGIAHPTPAALQAQAQQIEALIASHGPGGAGPKLPPGVFWQVADAG